MKNASNLFLSLFASALAMIAITGCGAGSGEGQKDTGNKKSNQDPPIKIVGFDEHDETLQAIIDGEVHGTVVQDPYMYGYKSVEVLNDLAAGKELKLEGGSDFIDFPARKIKLANAAAFWKEKKDRLEAGQGDAEYKDGRTTVAYITNGIDPFWTIAAAGAKKAAKDLDVNVLLRFPPKGAADQKSMIEALMVKDDVSGIAVSPIDPKNQAELLNGIGDKKHYITHDADAPSTNRKCYIGMNNYDAGRMAGQLVKEALPEGGKVMIFVGRLGQLNAEQRRQGLIDELLDRSRDPTRRDEPGKEIKGEKYTIVGTLTDNFDKAKAKQNAQDAISKHPDLGCMVGLFAYNPPLCLQAVKAAGREVKPDTTE